MRLSKTVLDSPSFRHVVNREWLSYPERIIQIGEGRFLRGFADWYIHQLNKRGVFRGRIVVVAPRPTGSKNIDELNAQDGLYTVRLQGISRGELVDEHEVITSVSRGIDPASDWRAFLQCAESRDIDIMISNTTESGLMYHPEPYVPGHYQTSFPAKVTAYLHHRYQFFRGDPEVGLTILPCELLDNNGQVLRDVVLQYATDWNLSHEFITWVTQVNRFCNTLVDRIVTGFPHSASSDALFDELGYEDHLVTDAEPFFLWAIEGDERLERRWMTDSVGINVHIVEDVSPFRLSKVRILNGAHTAMLAPAFLSGIHTVAEAVCDDTLGTFVHQAVYHEIIPSLAGDPFVKDELCSFASDVLERFRNPYLHHQISSLALNGLSKIRVRMVPTIQEFSSRFGSAPKLFAASFAAHLLFYRNQDSLWEIADDVRQVQMLQDVWLRADPVDIHDIVERLLSLQDVWGTDLTSIRGFTSLVAAGIQGIETSGPLAYFQQGIIDSPGNTTIDSVENCRYGNQ